MSRPCRSGWTISALLVWALVACGGDSPPGDLGAATFRKLCVTCHGETGHGDGPGAAALDPKPRTFTDGKWQASVTDDHIKKTILYGGAAVGKSAAMPAQPQLRSKPEVLNALVAHVRKFTPKSQ
jgi:mono/diheme cytochrome c family protein